MPVAQMFDDNESGKVSQTEVHDAVLRIFTWVLHPPLLSCSTVPIVLTPAAARIHVHRLPAEGEMICSSAV